MSNNFPREDVQPWYRQFWPWVLILLPASVVVAGLATVFIAHEGADDLVIDEYYKDGLAINRKLEKIQRAQELDISASLRIVGEEIQVSTRGPVSSTQLQLLLSHPLESNQDFTVILVESTPGQYLGRLLSTIAPRWHWTLELAEPEGWRLDGSITVAEFDSASGN
jgi:hypothetical protein